MRVALNLVYLVPGETGGMETYARELIPLLADRGVELTALVSRAAAGEDLGCETVVVPVDARSRVEWVRGEQQHVPRLAQQAGAEVLHSLASTAPLHGRVPRVTTIHDLAYKLVPETHFGMLGLGMGVLVPSAARRSQRIIAISESTAHDLRTHLRLAPGKIDVVPQGVSPPRDGPADPAAVRAELRLGGRAVLLSASAKRPHKNIGRLLEALARIPRPRRPALVVPGYPTAYEAELRRHAAALGLGADVVFPAWLSTTQMEGLYALSTAVVFPSLYEGFGLPVLEAMVRGVPVACSDRSSLPEVAGDAALLFDPENVGAMTVAIERLLGDSALRDRLADAGRARARAFTWERTADGTLASYERALRAT